MLRFQTCSVVPPGRSEYRHKSVNETFPFGAGATSPVRILCVDGQEDTCRMLTAMLGLYDLVIDAIRQAIEATRRRSSNEAPHGRVTARRERAAC